MDPLRSLDGDLVRGEIVDRPNRFVVTVAFDGPPERVFLGDPGALENVIEAGRPILCSPANDPDRKTGYDAIAVRAGDIYVSVRAAFANELFRIAISKGLIPPFDGYRILESEPKLPDHGRTDFLLEGPAGDPGWVEVKSCTHVEDGIAKFPDRQTERGRRHLRALETFVEDGDEAHVVFVVQRPDAQVFRPYRTVDSEFADLLARVAEAGVGLHAIVTAFEPPTYWLRSADLPIELA